MKFKAGDVVVGKSNSPNKRVVMKVDHRVSLPFECNYYFCLFVDSGGNSRFAVLNEQYLRKARRAEIMEAKLLGLVIK